MITQGKFKILYNKRVGLDYFKMVICAPKIAQRAKPGQFVHLRCQNSPEPLLRRPFSFHRLNRSNFEIIYKVVGWGTNLLAKKQKGDRINVLGPLGNGFDIKKPVTSNQKPEVILIAGGMGVAPLLALAEELLKGQRSKVKGQRQNNILVLLGAKNRKQILCAKDFARLGAKFKIATDDGSKGHKGSVVNLLNKILLSTIKYKQSTIYACGPRPMLKEIAHTGLRFRILAYGSLEENMACGLGACLGCAIRTKVGYKRVCKDGPVFNLQEIEWSNEATTYEA